MSDIGRNLDLILRDEPNDWHPLDSAMELVTRLNQAQQTVADITHQLSSLKSKMAADLAINLRKAKPGLSVAVDKQGCKIGYKSKYLQFVPDVEQGIWRVSSPNARFLREFLKAHRRTTLLNSDLSIIIGAIVDYFTAHYRTLGEDVIGTGVLMLEGRQSTLLELADWRAASELAPIHPLCSRLNRRGVVPC